MKTAQLQIRVVEFLCPYCQENIEDARYGSHMFDIGAETLPDTLKCVCGKTSKTPAAAKKLALKL